MSGVISEKIIAEVMNAITETGMFPDNTNRVLAGVSGGADSICLLHVLLMLKDELGLELAAAHLNHGIRGEEADADEDFVRQFSRSADIPFFSEKIDVPALHSPGGPSIEQICRDARMRFLKRIALSTNADKIAVAHTKSDQAETVLLRLIRGASLRGLSAMGYINGDIVRPLLNSSASDVRAYCNENNLPFRVDSTNEDTAYSRNKVRRMLLPLIKSDYNPEIEERLFETSRILRCDSDFLECVSASSFEDCLIDGDKNYISFDRASLASLHDSILSRVLVEAYYKIETSGFRQLENKHIKAMISGTKTGAPASLNLPGGLFFSTCRSNVTIRQHSHQESQPFIYDIELPSDDTPAEKVFDHPGFTLTLNLIFDGPTSVMFSNKDENIAYLDYSKMSGMLSIRNRMPGDRFAPLGMAGIKKLQDFFTDELIPIDKRDTVPILTCDGDIAWIAGMRIDDRFKITPDTKIVLKAEVRFFVKQ